MIRDTFINDEYARVIFLEGAKFGAQETLHDLMEGWDGNPKRKGAVADCMKKLNRFTLEKERAANMGNEKDVRPVTVRTYTGSEIGRFINDIIPTNREAKSWVQKLLGIIGASTFVATAVVVLALGMGAT